MKALKWVCLTVIVLVVSALIATGLDRSSAEMEYFDKYVVVCKEIAQEAQLEVADYDDFMIACLQS